jgi:PAS domain S-box-containing protein
MLILKILDPSYFLLVFDFVSLLSFIAGAILISKEVSSNQKLEKIKKNTLEGIINDSALVSRADSKGKITYVNSLFCDTSGYKKHELLGKDHKLLNSGKHDRDFWNQMYQSVVKHKTIWNEIVTNRKKDGSEYIVDSWITGEFDEKGNHIGYFSARHDLTSLYASLTETKDKEQELSAIMKGIDQSSATLEFCTNGFIINANEKFLELSGYGTLHEITGKHHSIFMDAADTKTKEYYKFWNDLKSGKPRYGEFQKLKENWISK